MTGWQTTSLGEISTLISRGVAPKYVESGGIAVLNQKCVRDHTVNTQFARRHDNTVKHVKADRLVQIGDVLVNSTGTGTLGRVGFVSESFNEPTTVDTHVTIVRPKPDTFIPKFFGYMMVSIEDQLKAAGVGTSGQTELSRTSIANEFQVSFPTNLAEQQRIVGILDQAFEGIAKAKANAERNLANANELFESELRMSLSATDGWKSSTLAETCEMYQPKTISAKEMIENAAYPVFGANGQIGFYDKYNHKESEILVTCRGATCGTVNVSLPMSWVTGNAMVVKPSSNNFSKEFLKWALIGQVDLLSSITGSAQPQITRTSLNSLQIRYPEDPAIQDKLCERINILSDYAKQTSQIYRSKIVEIQNLGTALLHQAFSGNL